MERLRVQRGGTSWFAAAAVPYCTGPVSYENRRPLETDLQNLTAACAAEKPAEAFMNAASPGDADQMGSSPTAITETKMPMSKRSPMR